MGVGRYGHGVGKRVPLFNQDLMSDSTASGVKVNIVSFGELFDGGILCEVL